MPDAGRALRGVTNKDSRAVLKRAMQAGCEVSLTRGNHVRITTPSGTVLRTGLTSSSRSAAHQLERDLRRAGVPL